MKGWFANIKGQRFGRLVALTPSGKAVDGHLKWLCQCDCGNQRIVSKGTLRSKGGTNSCGCLRAEAQRKRVLKNGAWNDGKSYAIQNGERCYKTRHAWAKAVLRHYGNRCEICGWADAKCDAHHRTPKASGGLHTISNGMVVCPNHHRILETKR